MADKQILLDNTDKIHTTEMGADRIKKIWNWIQLMRLNIAKAKYLIKAAIYKQGKNYYCEIDNIKITINSYSYTIITAHIIKSN